MLIADFNSLQSAKPLTPYYYDELASTLTHAYTIAAITHNIISLKLHA